MADGQQYSPVYVLHFGTKLSVEDIEWVLKKLTQKKDEGGAEVTIACAPPSIDQGLTVFASLPEDRYIKLGRQLKLKHRFDPETNDTESENEDEEAVYNSAEKLLMIRHEINSVRATRSGKLPSGRVNLWQGQSIVEKLVNKEWIEKIYPLHEEEDLKRLSHEWYGLSVNSFTAHQPLDKVREYFGEGVAFYFGFLDAFTWSLIFPSVIGVIHNLCTRGPSQAPQSPPEAEAEILPEETPEEMAETLQTLPASSMFTTHLFFCLLYMLWAFGFMEFWKRRSSELSYTWGTHLKTAAQKSPRANYKGHLVADPVTGEMQPHYPRWKTLVKLYCASLPVVGASLLVAFWVMMQSIWIEADVTSWTSSWEEGVWASVVGPVLVTLPSIIYSIGVFFANFYYRRLITRLTEWENHRTESQFERNRVTKLVLFEFVNNFMSLFYIAFYLQDIDMLRWQVVIMLFVNQAINQLVETVIPYWTQSRSLKSLKREEGEVDKSLLDVAVNLKLSVVDVKDSRVARAEKEALLDPYEGMHEDYLELYIQFGYILLFMVTYPTAAFWAWVNNVLELRVDAFKLTRTQRRPGVHRVANIGAWQPAFHLMVSMAVVTNCALLFIMSEKESNDATDATDAMAAGSLSSWRRAWICVSVDHILLALQSLLGIVVPSVPASVKAKIAARRR